MNRPVLLAHILVGILIAGPCFFTASVWAGLDDWENVHAQMGLTSEQEASLKSNREFHLERVSRLRDEISRIKMAIREELQKPDFDIDRVRALHRELKVLKIEKEDARLEAILEVRGILTPDQFSGFLELKEQRKTKWKQKK